MTFQKSHYINGQWVGGAGTPFHSTNPADEIPIWHGHQATQIEVDQAVTSAHAAFTRWRRLSVQDRLPYLQSFAFQLEKNRHELALAISQEAGKPLWESHAEIQSMIGKIDISIKAYEERCPTESAADIMPGADLVTHHRPHGVMGVLGPFNFPGHIPNGHIIPALLAGNTIVFKPSELTPYVAELTIKCWEAADIPAGVINLVQGGSETGKLLSSHPGLSGLLFTGSWNVGKKLSELYAATPYKILALEMGGNNALVVGSVKDVDAAAYNAVISAFQSAGQRCTCARRLIIQNGERGDHFLKRFADLTQALTIGPYTDKPEPFYGPVISAQAAESIFAQYQVLIKLGAKPLVPMKRLPQGSAFLSPAILDATGINGIPDHEIFGPLILVYRVDTFQHAIKTANHTAYGLTAALLSDDREEFEAFFAESTAGVINWNAPTNGARSAAPFGGTGQSGNNRPSAFYAADYCSYPVASVQASELTLPEHLSPGITLQKDTK